MKLSFKAMDVINIYRSPNPEYQRRLPDFIRILIKNITRRSTLICGDFNVDVRRNPNNLLVQTLKKEGFTQIVKEPTNIHGSTIDHVYVRGKNCASYFLHYPYYTDHEAVCVTLQKK